MNEVKQSEDIDFTLYDHINEFTIGEIAKLWCGIDIYAPIPPDKLPEAKAIGRKIIGAIKSKTLESKFPSNEYSIDNERLSINYEIISKDMTSYATWASIVIKKEDLLNWANTNKHKPMFLFHDEEEINSGFPPDTKWEDMTWIFISNEMIRVEAKGVSKKYQYSDLGFTDKRKGDAPDSRWTILQLFAEHNGEVSWGSKTTELQKNTISAAVKVIRKRLKNFFNISDDPFHSYRKTNSYKTKFTIKDARENRDEINSNPEDCSKDAIKQYIEDDEEVKMHQETGRTNTNYDEEQ